MKKTFRCDSIIIKVVLLIQCALFFSACKEEPLDNNNNTIIPLSLPRYVHINTNVGDVHPVYFNNQLYMYYLKTGGNYQSALMKSSNLATFKETPITTDPEAEKWSILYVFKKENEYISYHSTTGNSGIGNDILKGSSSPDLLNWKLMGHQYTVQPPSIQYNNYKDPYVFWNEDTKSYWAVRSGQETQGGTWSLFYYTSTDLTRWQDKGTLYRTNNVYGPIECPQMFKYGKYWYLLYSEYTNRVGKPQYFYSADGGKTWNIPNGDNCLNGEDLCAAQVVNVKGKWLLYGWIPSKDTETIGHQEWGGVLNLPHELGQLPDGRLTTKLEATTSRLIRGSKLKEVQQNVTLNSTGETPAEKQLFTGDKRFDLTFSFDLANQADKIGLQIAMAGISGTQKINVEFSNQTLWIKTGDNTVHASLRVPIIAGKHQVRVISDKDILECFVDDTYSLSAMVSTDVTGANTSLYVSKGVVTFSDIRLYQLNNLNSK